MDSPHIFNFWESYCLTFTKTASHFFLEEVVLMLSTNQPFFPTDAWVERPPEFWLLPQKARRGFIWRIAGLDASYVLCTDLLAVLCWTSTVWTEQSSCLNDLAALCTIIHLTGGSQCPAEGLHLLWPLAVHSDKGTSMEYFRDPQHMYIDVYGCILILNIFISLWKGGDQLR